MRQQQSPDLKIKSEALKSEIEVYIKNNEVVLDGYEAELTQFSTVVKQLEEVNPIKPVARRKNMWAKVVTGK